MPSGMNSSGSLKAASCVKSEHLGGERIINREILARSDSSKLMPFHDGMTLCSGQSTMLRIEIPTAPPIQGI
jgi:hypothetical protein